MKIPPLFPGAFVTLDKSLKRLESYFFYGKHQLRKWMEST